MFYIYKEELKNKIINYIKEEKNSFHVIYIDKNKPLPNTHYIFSLLLNKITCFFDLDFDDSDKVKKNIKVLPFNIGDENIYYTLCVYKFGDKIVEINSYLPILWRNTSRMFLF
jgi:hypothetical protein